MISPLLAVEHDGPVALFRMQDPERRNALGADMLWDLTQALTELPKSTRGVILAAEGRVWCAGFDIGALAPGLDPLDEDGPLKALFRAVRECHAPVIAMLQGSAWGGGTDLALRCDIAVAAPECTLAFTPGKLGLPYDAGGLLHAMRRGGLNLAMEMFATADPIPAARALQAGLLNHVVPAAELEGFTRAMAHRIAALAPLSVQSAKQQLRALAEATALPEDVAARLAAGRRLALDSEDYRDGIAAFHARRPPVFRGQ